MSGLPITYTPGFLDKATADLMFKDLWNELAWIRHDKVPRREYYCHTLGLPYGYGSSQFRRSYYPQPMHPAILTIGALLEAQTGAKFEVCFLNGYENQSDQLGWHSDNSPEMDDARPIAIVSLGVEREIWFRELPTLGGDTNPYTNSAKLKLEHGSLCLMHPGMQDTHQHRIPKAGFQCGERISLTFRGYVDAVTP
jgi:alkylated DNA repair dioxygenase AlkB